MFFLFAGKTRNYNFDIAPAQILDSHHVAFSSKSKHEREFIYETADSNLSRL